MSRNGPFEPVRRLRELVAFGGAARPILVTGGDAPHYAGLHRRPADSLLEAVLTLVESAGPEEIVLYTGAGSHLPLLAPANGLRVGVDAAAWRFRKAPEAGPAPAGASSETEDDEIPDTAALLSRFGTGGDGRVEFLAQGLAWPARLERLLASLEERCRAGGQRARLALIDSHFLLPDTGRGDPRELPSSHQARDLECRFSALPAACARAGVALVVLCSSASHAAGLLSGGIVAGAVADGSPAGAARFPTLSWPSAERIDWPSVSAQAPFGPFLPGASGARNLYEAVRTRAVALPAGALDALGRMEGLASVKRQMRELAIKVEQDRKRAELGLSVTPFRKNAAFVGSPGTGKTTVAQIYGRLLHELGLLPTDRYLRTSAPDLIARHVRESAHLTREKCREAQGGVLFVDEAYALCSGGPHDFASEAVTELMLFMDRHPEDLVVLFAGYSEEIGRLLGSNPGLSGKVPLRFDFEDHDDDALVRIALAQIKAAGDEPGEGATEALRGRMRGYKTHCESAGAPFDNARAVENLLEAARRARAARIAGLPLDAKTLSVLTGEDISRADVALPPPARSSP